MNTNQTQNTSIKLRGVRQNNLKGFDLDLPLNRFIVITGPSGSGKSSLAFETLYAEGQRRYIETFSPYTRQFFDRMDKPRVDSVENIPPAIAIEQRNSVKTSRSTVGTMTEICDYMKVLMPFISQLHCKNCGKPVRRDSPQSVWEKLSEFAKTVKNGAALEVLVTFSLPLSEKLSLKDSLKLVEKQGYQRLLIQNEVVRIDDLEEKSRVKSGKKRKEIAETEVVDNESEIQQILQKTRSLVVVQDRVKLEQGNRARFIDACEQAYHFGKGALTVYFKTSDDKSSAWTNPPLRFSNRLHCADCDIGYDEPQPALFSYNNPIGACPACHGFGRIITIDWNEVIPDPSLSIEQEVISPWRRGYSRECFYDLLDFCEKRNIPTHIPFKNLPNQVQQWIINGDPDYGIDSEHSYPHAWYGVKGFFDYLEKKKYKMHVRVFLSRYRKYVLCPECNGGRLKPEALLYKLLIDNDLANRLISEGKCKSNAISLAEFYLLPIEDAFLVIDSIWKKYNLDRKSPVYHALEEVHTRLKYLVEIGLGYLTLNRSSRTLSGGEAERVNLTTCLGTRLVNTLYVLDEPSIGLHPRDTERLIKILKNLRDLGNTVVVVEHDPDVIKAADHIVDLGPASGENGGNVVFQGSYPELLNDDNSLTAKYLCGREVIEIPSRRPVRKVVNGIPTWACPVLTMAGATRHNLKNLEVKIPLQRFVCVTGVSGSGKSTMVRECLVPALSYRLKHKHELFESEDPANISNNNDDNDETDEEAESLFSSDIKLDGYENIDLVEVVDQSPIGRTPRSNPAIYLKIFDYIRNLFGEVARENGMLKNSMLRLFSFNTPQGRCPHCLGMGYEKIEMQFLSDVYIKCPMCQGKRFNQTTLDIRICPDSELVKNSPELSQKYSKNIAEALDFSVEECIQWLKLFKPGKDLEKAIKLLEAMVDVGLGYLKLGQPLTTLSGGECQRLKLAKAIGRLYLAISASENRHARNQTINPRTLFVFDEPTTGLHLNDIRVLLNAFQKLVAFGHSVLVIEHNLEVIKCADWIIDLGPEAGERGGKIVVCGAPEEVAACPQSYTGMALRAVLNRN